MVTGACILEPSSVTKTPRGLDGFLILVKSPSSLLPSPSALLLLR